MKKGPPAADSVAGPEMGDCAAADMKEVWDMS